MQITTPSNYIVTLKDKLTFGEVRNLQKQLFEGVKIKMEKGAEAKTPEMDMTNLLEYNDKAIPMLVTKIVKGEAEITSGFEIEINSWDYADGQMVLDAVEKILAPVLGNQSEEKKTQ